MFVVVALLAIMANEVSAQINREAELKGKMVGLLGNLVTWPNDTAPTVAKPLTIGIIGDDPFVDGRGVNHLQQKLAGTGAVILNFPDASAYRECHVLVVSKSTDFEKALAKTKGNPVLVVSEAPRLAKKGATVNLVFDQASNKIRLEINPSMAKNANLQINPGLLRSPLVDIVN
ncbi:MAG: YfiR family protein [Planctomycetia bacterium]|nr:YfiR family protein [Planctomycetia bacterium]